MTMFYLLEEYEDELLWSGDIFRVFIQNKGENYYTDRVVDFIIFETEGQYREEIYLTRKPTLKHIKGENL